MNIDQILSELHTEHTQIEEAIIKLERLVRVKGRMGMKRRVTTAGKGARLVLLTGTMGTRPATDQSTGLSAR